jgi:hypothetical protein
MSEELWKEFEEATGIKLEYQVNPDRANKKDFELYHAWLERTKMPALRADLQRVTSEMGAMKDAIRQYLPPLLAAMKPETCMWIDNGNGTWTTGCGHLCSGGFKECQYCHKPIEQKEDA